MTPSRTSPLTSLYVAGPLSMGYVDFYTFLIPLYALSLGFDASEIGILVGARSIVAMFLSIHIGVLMDRFGTRKVTLFFVWAGMAMAPLFPLVPWFWTLLLLQLINGAAVSFAWSGAQTLIAQLVEGDARYLGRFTFFARLGSTTAPILAGIAWDFGGAWPAYLLGAAWGAVLTFALLCAPEATATRRDDARAVPRPRCVAPIIGLPQFHHADRDPGHCAVDGDHVDAKHDIQHPDLGLCRLPRPGGARRHHHRHSVLCRRDRKRVRCALRRSRDAQRTMLSGTALSIFLIAATPLLGGIFAFLLLCQLVRGWLEGVIQPVVLSVQARAVGRHQQGAVVGLRQTGQRLSSIMIPPLMGGIADRWGVSESFFILGALMLLLCLPVALIIRRTGRVRSADEPHAD